MAKDKSKKKDKAEPEVEVEETTTKKAKKDKGSKAEKPSKSKADEPEEDVDDLDPTGPGDRFSIKDHVGELLLVTPTGLKRDYKTSAGISDAIVANVVVLDPDKPKKSEEFRDAFIFQSVLVGNLKDKVGVGMIAAKLVMGEKSEGKSAPYLFEKSDEAKTAARAWIKANGPTV